MYVGSYICTVTLSIMADALTDDSDIMTEDEDLLPTQPVDDRILKDVVVYVEVRSTNDNRSAAISKELQQLGARVCKKFTDDVTHVVYKEGSKRTRNKAQKKGIHLVSVLWVDSCKKNQEHVSERMYPVYLPDEKSTPLFIAKLKKAKSMQPKDFNEDIANSAERCNKRKRRLDMIGRLKSNDNTPISSPRIGGILVLDTQPRSPLEEDILTPVRLAVPDTPPSMKAKMQSLKKQKLNESVFNISNSSVELNSEKESLERKLFDNENCATDLETLINTPKPSPKSLNNTPLSEDKTDGSKRKSVRRRKSLATPKVSQEDSDVLPVKKINRRRSVHSVSSVDSIGGVQDNTTTHQGLDATSRTNSGRRKKSCLLQNKDTYDTTNTKKSMQQNTSVSNTHQTSEVERLERVNSKTSHSDILRNIKPKETRNRRKSMISISMSDSVTKDSSQKSSHSVAKERRKTVMFEDGIDCFGTNRLEDTRKARRKSTPTQNENSEDTTDNAITKITDSLFTSKQIGKESEQIEKSEKKGKSKVSDAEFDKADGHSAVKKVKSKKKNLTGKKLLAIDNVEPCQTLIEPDHISQKSRSAILENSCIDTKNSQKDSSTVNGKKNRKRRVMSKDSEQCGSPNKQMKKCTQKSDTTSSETPKYCDVIDQNEISSGSEDRENDLQRRLTEVGLSCSGIGNASLQSTAQESKLGMSMSAVFGDDTLSSSGLSRPRPSVDEFNFRKFMPKLKNKDHVRSRKALSESSIPRVHNHNTSSESKSNSDSDNSTSLSKHSKWKENSFRQKLSPNRPSLVMTSLHTHEQDAVIAIVKKLRGFVISDNVSDATTHVVCGGPRRTLNLLYGLARGCWLLHQNWVLESLDAGRWLPEEKYEISNWFPAVQVTRQARGELKEKYKSSLFASVGTMFVSHKVSPPRSHIVSLIRLCGGQVTSSSSKASLIVGTDFYPDIMSVTPTWILDCIIQLEVIPVEDYLLGKPKRESSPEF